MLTAGLRGGPTINGGSGRGRHDSYRGRARASPKAARGSNEALTHPEVEAGG